MKFKLPGITIAVLVLTAASAFLIGAQQAAPTRQHWEYMDCANTGVVGQDDSGKDAGADGWELVAVSPPRANDSRIHFYYKRLK